MKEISKLTDSMAHSNEKIVTFLPQHGTRGTERFNDLATVESELDPRYFVA